MTKLYLWFVPGEGTSLMAARNCLDKSSSLFSPDDKGPTVTGKLNDQEFDGS